MISELAAKPVSTWLSEAPGLPLKHILKQSVFYPASALDFEPIFLLGHRFQSFVFADYNIPVECAISALRDIPGYDLDVVRMVDSAEVGPVSFAERPWEGMGNREPPNNDALPRPSAVWVVLQRRDYHLLAGQPQRISVVFVCGDGLAVFNALYVSNRRAPALMAIIQPGHGFGGNWTDFSDPGGPMARAVTENPAGAPEYLLEGGVGSLDSYETACWPTFLLPVWSGQRSREGSLRLWRRA